MVPLEHLAVLLAGYRFELTPINLCQWWGKDDIAYDIPIQAVARQSNHQTNVVTQKAHEAFNRRNLGSCSLSIPGAVMDN